ncbi:FtsX-like permease family protein [Streptomyces shaanxiensis]
MFLRARAHRLLLAAALLTVLLTTAVLATLTAYSGAIGDAALRHSLADPQNAADTALVVKASVPEDRRKEADTAVRDVARQTFDGLPVTVRTLLRSGPYALPRSLQPEAERSGDPDLTHFATLDRSRVRLMEGRLPRPAEGLVEVALPQSAARALDLRPGARFTLTDRLGGPAVRVTVTGLYRPVRADDPYWLLDDLHGRGINKLDFTTYGPLLADPGVLADGTVSVGASGWLVSADFATVTTARTDALREAARAGNAALRKESSLGGATTAATALPEVLDRTDRSLLLSRSTLLIVALQLVLLAGCALLLVAGLLSSERTGESRLLLARGASRGRIAGLAALEALLLALPALVCAPLLAGPLTRLLAGRGPLARIGLRLEVPRDGRLGVWLVAAGIALGCALAVTLPALTSSFARGRARTLPGAVRAGADLGLLVVAGVAYFQLSRQTSGAVTDDSSGVLGVDPLLVAAPALALLAGTVLTLRLLPPLARLAERRAARGRGLSAALAGWQIARRPMRGAGPVLLLVLAVALGMLAIGQGASWNRSQSDQADFRAGAPVRVLTSGDAGLGRTEEYAAVPGVRRTAPAVRSELPLSGSRVATVLALDTSRASMLIRSDLHSGPFLQGLGPKGATTGLRVPAGTTRLRLTAVLSGSDPSTAVQVAVTLEDRYGTPHRLPIGQLPGDGRVHALDAHLPGVPLTLTDLELVVPVPNGSAEQHRFTLDGLTATSTDGTVRPLPLPTDWKASSRSEGVSSTPDDRNKPTRPRLSSGSGRPTVRYGTGFIPSDDTWSVGVLTVRLKATQPKPAEITAVATRRFLDSASVSVGESLDVPLGGENVSVRIVRSVPAGALGLAAALLAIPAGRAGAAVWAAVAVTAVTCAALPLRAAAAHRLVRMHTGREDVASVRPSRRRTVAELTLLVLAAGAVESLRRRGTSGSAGDLVSLAPVLLGVIAALVLVRLYPLPLRGLARPAARLRGAVAHLSLARAGRTSASAVLPLLALLTALTTAAFGGSVLAGVREARDHAALLSVGADARVESAAPLPSGLPDRLRRTPGVSDVSTLSVTFEAKPADGAQTVPLVGVDPADYAALSARTGLGAFPRGDLKAAAAGAPAPALASTATARTYGTRPFPVLLPDGSTLTVRITAVLDRTPAVSGPDFLIVNRTALGPAAARPTGLLLTGENLDGTALREAAPKTATVRLRSEERAGYVDSPLQTGAERVYTTAVAAGTGYAVLALLLSLLRTAPERTALLARLRTMGLTRAAGRRLLILESLPQAVLAALGGVLTGWATIRLLSPGIDLTALALPTAEPGAGAVELRMDLPSLAIPAVAVLLLAVGVGVGQAWWSGRRGSVTELRAGDAR